MIQLMHTISENVPRQTRVCTIMRKRDNDVLHSSPLKQNMGKTNLRTTIQEKKQHIIYNNYKFSLSGALLTLVDLLSG